MVANLIQIQDKLKDLSDSQLRDVFSSGSVPQFMVMTEMGRRKEMKEEYQKNQAQAATTVAEDILSSSTNMARGLGALAQPQNRMATQPQNLPIENTIPTMPPSPQPMANKLPVTRMADGGLAKMKYANGGIIGEVELPPRIGKRTPITPYTGGITPFDPVSNPLVQDKYSTNFGLFDTRLEDIVNRQQPKTVFSPSLIASEAAAQKSLTDAQAALTEDSVYGDLATSLAERQEGISDQRNEAAGLALLEAAARIAGSRSPFLGQAIGEAAPAIGTYGKSLSEVRRQENALFDAQTKLAQLEMAEKAGRKEEVRKLRTELLNLDSVRRDIEDKAFNRFKTRQQLDLQVLGAEKDFAVAKSAEERDKTRLQLAEAKNKRESFDLENQLGETQANISDLKEAMSKGLNLDGTPHTMQQKNLMQFQLKDLEAKKTEITKAINQTKSANPLTALTAQAKTTQEALRINDVITDLKKQYGIKEAYVAFQTRSGKSKEKAEREWDDAQVQIERLNQRRRALLGGLSGSTSAANDAAQNVNFKVK